MNKFEQRIYDLQFSMQLDFFTRMINSNDTISNKHTKINGKKDLNVKPLDFEDYKDSKYVEVEPKQPKKINPKFLKFGTLFLILVALIFGGYGFFVYSSNSDRDQIINYMVNSESAQRLNTTKYFIDSKQTGTLALSQGSKSEEVLSDLKNKLNGDIKLDSTTLPYINLASNELKNSYRIYKNKIELWLSEINEIEYESKEFNSELKQIEALPTSEQRINSKLAFYKNHGLFDNVKKANQIYNENKQTFDELGDFDISNTTFKPLAFDQLVSSDLIDYGKLVENIQSFTDIKYKQHNLVEGTGVKIITDQELKEFVQKLENMDLATVESKFGKNVEEYNLENFTSDFQKLKKELRKKTGINENNDNNLNSNIEDQKLIQRVKNLFKNYDSQNDLLYCNQAKTTEYRSTTQTTDKHGNTIEVNSDQDINDISKKCDEIISKRENVNPQTLVSAQGVNVIVNSKMYRYENNGIDYPISLVLFNTSSDAQNFISERKKALSDMSSNLKDKTNVDSIAYNGSKIVILLPNGTSNGINTYLSQVGIYIQASNYAFGSNTSWSYYDLHENYFDELGKVDR